MKQILLIIITFLTANSFAQVFHVDTQHGTRITLYKDQTKNELLNEVEFIDCFCDSIIGKDSSIYYVPKNEDKGRILVRRFTGWGLLKKTGEDLSMDFSEPDPYTYDATGKKIILKGFKNVGRTITPNPDSYIVKIDTTTATADSPGEELLKYFVKDDHKGHFLASEDGRWWGISNVNMRSILKMAYDPARYDFTDFRFNPNGLVVLESRGNDNKYGVMTYQGRTQIGFRFDFMAPFISNEDTIYAEINAKKGFINKHGGVVLPLIHEKLPMVWTDSNLVATEKSIWIMKRNFKQLGSYRWQKLEREGDVYMVKKNNVWGILDLDLKPIVKPQYYSIDDGPRIKAKIDFKTYVVVKNGKIGVIDLKGNYIIPCKYNCRCTLGYFSPAGYFIELANGDKAYRFDENGQVVSESSASGKACLCESYD